MRRSSRSVQALYSRLGRANSDPTRRCLRDWAAGACEERSLQDRPAGPTPLLSESARPAASAALGADSEHACSEITEICIIVTFLDSRFSASVREARAAVPAGESRCGLDCRVAACVLTLQAGWSYSRLEAQP